MKKTIIGFIAGVIVATAIPVGASAVYTKLTALERPDYVLIVDGKEVDASIVTINGTTYLPVRKVSEVVGKDVSFASGTITLSDPVYDKKDTVTEKVTVIEKGGVTVNPDETLNNLNEALATYEKNMIVLQANLDKANQSEVKPDTTVLEKALELTREKINSIKKEISDIESNPQAKGDQ